MKFSPHTDSRFSAYDASIDAALRIYGGAAPAPGLESRVAARIAATTRHGYRSATPVFTGSRWMVLLRGVSVGALASAGACAIVIGTVRHSQRIEVPQAAGVIRPGGIRAPGGTRVPTRALPQSATIDPQAPRSEPHSRATVSRNAGHKAAGSAVPRSPYPPDQAPSDPQR